MNQPPRTQGGVKGGGADNQPHSALSNSPSPNQSPITHSLHQTLEICATLTTMSLIPNSSQEMQPPPAKNLWLPATETTLAYLTKRFTGRILGSLLNGQEGWSAMAVASSGWAVPVLQDSS